MKKNFLLLAAALALLVTTGASAQTINLKANVPFSFVVDRTTLPAGEYSVESIANSEGVLTIRGVDTKTARLIMSHACESVNTASHAKLVFHRYGDQYFLSQVWVGGNNRGHELLPSAREKEVAKDFRAEKVMLAVAGR